MKDMLKKVQPRLRVFASGSTKVNAQRAQLSQCVLVDQEDIPTVPFTAAPGLDSIALADKSLDELRSEMAPLPAPPKEPKVNVFIHTRDTGRDAPVFEGTKASRGNIVAAEVTLNQLVEIDNREEVAFVEASQPVSVPQPILSSVPAGSPAPRTRKVGREELHKQGEGVLIGIIDVQGFDFSHPDFLDPAGKTRFLRIWDQGGVNRLPPAGAQFNFGSELNQTHLDAALAAAQQKHVPAYELEPQSSMAPSSHGTHVTSIATGNSGLCPKAGIVAVLLALPESDWERRKSFIDSSRIMHAIDYLLEVARQEAKPIAINVSLGTNGHAHDSSSAVSRWLDSAMSLPGRALCVAAGNAGQEKAEYNGDHGFIMGRIHTSGQILGRTLANDIEWMVIGNGIEDVSENELEIWYSPQDRFRVYVKPPDEDWIGPVAPGEYIENRLLNNRTVLSVFNERYHHANGCNYVSVFLSPYFGSEVVGIKAGLWKVRLEAEELRNGKYHGWIERDDLRPVGRTGERQFWNFPSFFSERSNVDVSSVTSLACGQRVIGVANLDEAQGRINKSSSQGPTRDGRFKPDVAAPGTDIVAANGFLGEVEPWIGMTGTSMASPYVAGVVGLMLAVEPKLTAAQIEGIIQRTARPLPSASFEWRDDAGFGIIDPEACVREAAEVNLTRRIQ